MTITEFLLARIAEDEEQARQSVGPMSEDWRIVEGWREGVAARVLAECQAKRAIVEHEETRLRAEWRRYADEHHQTWEAWLSGYPTPILGHLAAVYADHPDHDPAWRP